LVLKLNHAGPLSGVYPFKAVILILGACGITILEFNGANDKLLPSAFFGYGFENIL
tara:strand:+ start:705 stop:872 length:168 start_codon:yes stop_codon:yes gene_type:complete